MKKLMLNPIIITTLAFFVISCSTKPSPENENTPATVDETEVKESVSEAISDTQENISEKAEEMSSAVEEGIEKVEKKAENLNENTYVDEATGTLVYTFAEESPSFEGGESEMMKYLRKNLKYPKDATRAGAEGTAYVSFVVDEDGSIRNSEIARPTENKSLDEEAVRVVSSMPNWIPGKQNGENVAVKYTIPITFKLQ
ncbi:MAG: TonB family protein [Bacteroidota bacterium]